MSSITTLKTRNPSNILPESDIVPQKWIIGTLIPFWDSAQCAGALAVRLLGFRE